METQPSKNALVARSGNRAEDILCASQNVLDALGLQFFQKKIIKCEKVKGKKKSDVILTFEDESKTRCQVKNGTGGGRGWSFDRRSVDKMPTNESIKDLLKIVCLHAGGERQVLPNDKALISKLILGEEDDMKPQYILHTKVKENVIVSLSVCSISKFLFRILNDAFETCNAKKTCVHLSPYIYLQRKGGGKADHAPDDIQAKLRALPDIMTTINLD